MAKKVYNQYSKLKM
ncbi:hypothetical protein [Borreliella bavariensis]|nr:hypothetical protein [Borreliella bavariensis]